MTYIVTMTTFLQRRFLITLDEIMRLVDTEWVIVKLKWRELREKKLPCFDLLAVKATVVTNTTTRHVRHLEQVLQWKCCISSHVDTS